LATRGKVFDSVNKGTHAHNEDHSGNDQRTKQSEAIQILSLLKHLARNTTQ
jgi:hypothetical protein